MKIRIKVPSLGDQVREATMVEWLKQPGDKAAYDEAIAEVMTDKANVEIPSPTAGILLEHLVNAGDVVEPGTEIGTIDA